VGVRSLAPQWARSARALFGRKGRLEKLIVAANVGWLHYSESFDDGPELFAADDRMRLEGIVSKRRDAPYRSG
jgi:ATP-dependent DNA ligase